jgi:hypothetical protein
MLPTSKRERERSNACAVVNLGKLKLFVRGRPP